MPDQPKIDDDLRTEIESGVYRKLIEHLRKYPEVQNIDLMNLGYFCRNCISKWYRSAAAEQGIELGRPSAIQSQVTVDNAGGIARLQVGGIATRVFQGEIFI